MTSGSRVKRWAICRASIESIPAASSMSIVGSSMGAFKSLNFAWQPEQLAR